MKQSRVLEDRAGLIRCVLMCEVKHPLLFVSWKVVFSSVYRCRMSAEGGALFIRVLG